MNISTSMAVIFTNDSKAMAVTMPVLRLGVETLRVPKKIEKAVMMMQNSSASPS